MSGNKKKACCKHICKDCLHIIYYGENEYCPEKLLEPECAKYPIEELDCVTGETTTYYKRCSLVNKNGDCKKHKLNQPNADMKKLIKMLGKFKAVYHPMDWACRESIAGHLINDLLRVLDGKESLFIRCVNDNEDSCWGGDSPYDEVVIARDDLYCMTKRIKENKQ